MKKKILSTLAVAAMTTTLMMPAGNVVKAHDAYFKNGVQFTWSGNEKTMAKARTLNRHGGVNRVRATVIRGYRKNRSDWDSVLAYSELSSDGVFPQWFYNWE